MIDLHLLKHMSLVDIDCLVFARPNFHRSKRLINFGREFLSESKTLTKPRRNLIQPSQNVKYQIFNFYIRYRKNNEIWRKGALGQTLGIYEVGARLSVPEAKEVFSYK